MQNRQVLLKKSPGPLEWENPTVVRKLYRWCLKLLPKYQAVQVDGCMYHEDDIPDDAVVKAFWRTSFVTGRIDARHINVSSGKVYLLVGTVDEYTAHTVRGISLKLVNSFRHGFPPDWKQLINNSFKSNDDTLQQRITPTSNQVVIRSDEFNRPSLVVRLTRLVTPTDILSNESMNQSSPMDTQLPTCRRNSKKKKKFKQQNSDEFKKPSPVMSLKRMVTPTTTETCPSPIETPACKQNCLWPMVLLTRIAIPTTTCHSSNKSIQTRCNRYVKKVVTATSDEFKQPSPVFPSASYTTTPANRCRSNDRSSQNESQQIETEDKTEKNKPDSTSYPPPMVLHLSGRKNTLKRKKQLRNIFEEVDKKYMADDNFDSPVVQNKRLTIPAMNFSGLIQLSTPCHGALLESPQANVDYIKIHMSPSKTPHTNLTPPTSQVNRNEIDRYMNKYRKHTRRWNRNENPCSKKIKINHGTSEMVKCIMKEDADLNKMSCKTPVRGDPRRLDETLNASHSESEDYYWSDFE